MALVLQIIYRTADGKGDDEMSSIKGQCFDCYDHATFQYIGQTGEFDAKQVQLDYVSKLNKPSTIVDCVSCGRKIEYKEQDGKWKPTIK